MRSLYTLGALTVGGCGPQWVPGDLGDDTGSGSAAETGSTAVDDPPPADPRCDDPPSGPFSFDELADIETEEDFDFDALGFLLTQQNTELQGVSDSGQTHIVAGNIGPDASGIRSLSTGDVLVAQPNTGSLRLVDPETGGSTVVIGGLDSPNGLEATRDGRAFSSEFVDDGRIRLVDPYADEVTVIARMAHPNNMALSPDEDVLYVVTSPDDESGPSRILALDRDPSGAWSDRTRLVFEHPEFLGGIGTDSCGNVYAVTYEGGEVFRIRASDQGFEPIASLPADEEYSSVRFSPGIGGWARDQLFVTNREQVFRIPLGVDGNHVLAGR